MSVWVKYFRIKKSKSTISKTFHYLFCRGSLSIPIWCFAFFSFLVDSRNLQYFPVLNETQGPFLAWNGRFLAQGPFLAGLDSNKLIITVMKWENSIHESWTIFNYRYLTHHMMNNFDNLVCYTHIYVIHNTYHFFY